MADSSIKQVILLREQYPDGKGGTRKIRAGKMVAQGCHASMKVFFDRQVDPATFPFNGLYLVVPLTAEMALWVDGLFAKVVLLVESEDEMLRALSLAKIAGLPCALVTDCGLTEFGGVPTNTAVAIGPARAEEIDKITGPDGAIKARLA